MREDLGRGLEVKAFPRCVIVELGKAEDLARGKDCQVGFSGEEATKPADGIFDSALLPRRPWIAKECFDSEGFPQAVMESELGSVVEGHGAAQGRGKRSQKIFDGRDKRCGGLALLTQDNRQSRSTFVKGQDGLPIGGKEHEIGLPMARVGSVTGFWGSQSNGDTVLDVHGRVAVFWGASAALALAAGEVEPPGVILGASDLSGDEAINGFMTDNRPAFFAREPAGDLLRRPSLTEAVQDQSLEVGPTQQFAAGPAPCLGLLTGVNGLIPARRRAVALQLPSNARWRAIQTCRDLPDRLPGAATPGNLTPFLDPKLPVLAPHRSTPIRRCCTSFVKSKNRPGSQFPPHPPLRRSPLSRWRGMGVMSEVTYTERMRTARRLGWPRPAGRSARQRSSSG